MYARATATLALCLALTSPVWGAPAARSAASLTKSVARSLKLSGAADRRSKQALRKATSAEKAATEALAKGGPPGPTGPTGPEGRSVTGPTGAPGASMLSGWINTGDMPPSGGGGTYTPLGNGAPGGPSVALMTPNTPVVLRDLIVRVSDAPGSPDGRWLISLGGLFTFGLIQCEIKGTFATTCNTGAQTVTAPAGSFYNLFVDSSNSPNPASLGFAYRAVAP